MKLKVAGAWITDIKSFEAALEARLRNVGRHVGRQVASQATQRVKRRLRGTGWIRLYRDSIFFRETPEGGEWAVAGLVQQDNLAQFPAETSLASFTPSGDGRWPSEYNPWPIDVIPPAYYRGTTLVVRNAPESTVEEYRGARIQNLPTLHKVLAERGIRVIPNGLPVADNGVFADIAYLARRLELGYPGFKRVAHWGPAASETESNIERWMKDPKLLAMVDDAIMGATPGEVPTMSQAEASDLARLREATWP